MKKLSIMLSVAMLSTGLISGNASACNETVDVFEWRTSTSLDPLAFPMSEVVCWDNGFFDPITSGVFDHNFDGSNEWIDNLEGIITSWSEGGSLEAVRYNRYTIFPGTKGGTVLEKTSTITDQKLVVKVGNSLFESEIDPQNNAYQLSPQTLTALAEASRQTYPLDQVKILFLPSGITDEIGERTVRAFRVLYINESDENPAKKQQEYLEYTLKYGR